MTQIEIILGYRGGWEHSSFPIRRLVYENGGELFHRMTVSRMKQPQYLTEDNERLDYNETIKVIDVRWM